MSVSTAQPFGPFLFACFAEYRREFCPDGRISQKLWQEKCEEFHAAWHSYHDKKQVKRRAVVSSEAESIYALYPRKIGHLAAIAAILKAMVKCPHDVLIERVRVYAECVSKWPISEQKYIPHPSTWFNQGCYDDDPNTWIKTVNNYMPRNPAPAIDTSHLREMTDEERNNLGNLLQQLAK